MRRTFPFYVPTLLPSLVIQILASLLLWLFYIPIAGQVHADSSITQTTGPGDLGTIVTPNGNVYGITEGKPVGNNLFHSFAQFSVDTGDIAQFQTTTLLPNSAIHNILGRVTGQTPSSIFGTIDSASYYPGANLFLMNPNGIIFGPTATLNVGGMATFTTANYLQLIDPGIIHVDPAATSVLTSAPVTAFGFLGSNPPAAISVQGSTLIMQPGQSMSLVGGNQGFTYTNPDTGSTAVPNGVTVADGHLSARGGQVNLASVASPGEIIAGTLDQAPNINGESFGELGTIQVSQQSNIDVSGNGGGTVLIRGGQFLLDNSTISANITDPGPVTNGVESIGSGIDIQVIQDAVIQNGALLNTTVSGNASPTVQYSGVSVKADRIEILGSQDFDNSPVTGIFSSVAQGNTGGSSGDIKMEANSILVRDFGTVTTFLETATDGAGNAGDIALKATNNLELDGLVFVESLASASGNAGSIELRSTQGNILMTNSPSVNSLTGENFLTRSLSSGSVGSIAVNAPNGDIRLTGNPEFGPAALFTHIEGTGVNAGKGGIQLTAKNLTIENSGIQIDNFTSFQPGDLTVNLTDTLSLGGTDIPSTLLTTTRRSARSADLNITAPDILLADGSRASTETYRSGDGGTLNIFTQHLELTSGAQITSGSIFNPSLPLGQLPETPSGEGGTITIQGLAGPASSVLITDPGSGIVTNTEGTGAGGNTVLSARTLTIQNGGTISASSTGTGNAGNITIKAESLTMASGGRVEASTSGAGKGGSIDITTTGDVTVTGLSADGQVRSGIFAKTQSAGSGGGGSGGGGGGGAAPKPGSAGSITINSKNLLLTGGAQIDSSTTSGGTGGTVSITTAENITIAGSSTRLTSDATRGNGKGGNITLVAKNITVHDHASVTAVTGGKGDAGNISLTALDQLLLQSAGDVTTSTSGSGEGGTITIQASQVLLDGQGSDITADTLRPFADMTITINILHPNVGDLVVQLDSPTGTRVALLSRVGGSGDNFTGTQFNDQATTPITSITPGSAPFTGEFTPREPLGQLNNELVAGNWTLNVRDQATGEVGSLESWTLQIGRETFQSIGGSKMIPDNSNVRSTIPVANPTVPTVQGVGEASGGGGDVTINAGSVTVQNGATMSATTRGSGQGGTVNVNATGQVALTGSGSGLFTGSEASGTGGNINVLASSMTMDNGATVSSASSRTGNAGTIAINAGHSLDLQDSSIKTEAGQARGGNLDIQAVNRVHLVNSTISASVADGRGGGGNISIDPQYVILQNSHILAQAAQGQGGEIRITTNLFLPDANSSVKADSGSGLNGTVTIQSPNAPISGHIQPLGKTPLIATSLLNQHCASLAGGEFSSFTVAGRDSLPTEPGSWLASPLATLSAGTELGTKGKGERSVARGEGEPPLLSLRQIVPAGFLTQAFAVDWSASCQS